MVMASLNSYQYLVTIATLLIIVLHHLFCPVFCFNQPQPSISRRDLLLEEKTRLGSIPPSCHNKCNACHPCMAVQVPTLPSHQRLKPGLTRTAPLGFSGQSFQGNNRESLGSNEVTSNRVRGHSVPLLGKDQKELNHIKPRE